MSVAWLLPRKREGRHRDCCITVPYTDGRHRDCLLHGCSLENATGTIETVCCITSPYRTRWSHGCSLENARLAVSGGVQRRVRHVRKAWLPSGKRKRQTTQQPQDCFLDDVPVIITKCLLHCRLPEDVVATRLLGDDVIATIRNFQSHA